MTPIANQTRNKVTNPKKITKSRAEKSFEMKYFTLLLVILSVFSCEGRLRSSSRRLGFVQNGWNRHNNAAIKYGPQVINAVNKWGPAVKHCVGGLCGMDTTEDEDMPSVGKGYRQPRCPPGEVFSSCHSNCPKTCKNRFSGNMCQAVCRMGCDCVRGYVRDTVTNKCIPSSYCPKLLPAKA